MALWDGATNWDGSDTWGFTNPPPEVIAERELLGAGVLKRISCPEIWSVNPDTLVLETKLPLRAKGGFRKINARNRMQQDDLEFTLDDPLRRYLPSGDLHSLVATNALLGLKWTVHNDEQTDTFLGNVFRVVEPPDRESTNQGMSAFSVQAEDWLRSPLNTGALYVGGFTPLREAILLKNAMVDAGCPIIGDDDNNWATVAAAILYYLAGNRLRVDGSWVSPIHPDPDDSESFNALVDPLVVQALNKSPSWFDVYNFLASLYRVSAIYDPDGVPHIRESRSRIDSGLAMACEDIGRLRIPYELPISRQISRPQYNKFIYYIFYIVETDNGPVSHIDFLAQATSNAINNPHVPPATTDFTEIARGNFIHNAAESSAQLYCEETLHRVLAESDVVTFAVDSSIPLDAYIRQDVYVQLPNDGITGWFTLNEINQPLDERPSSVVMNWAAD